MAKVGFIGLGNMGGPMVRNLIKAGQSLKVYDLSEEAINFAVQAGATATKSVKEASSEVDFVVTMVPVGSNVKEIFLENGILTAASPGTVMIDSSTIDVQSAQSVHEAAKSAGFNMIDAPVSGGVIGADAGTLTFMCGGDKESFEKAKPILQGMGKNIVHAGASGSGQAAKACNNMLLGISMIGISESFTLADRLGLDPKLLFDIMSSATGDCWALRNHLPIAGIVETSAANRSFSPGFAVAMMAKDLRLAEAAAKSVDLQTDLGTLASKMYTEFEKGGSGHLDYSAIINLIQKKASTK